MSQDKSSPSTKEINHVLRGVQSGNENVIEDLFEKYPNFHWTELYYEKTGDTVLHCASRLGLVNVIECLVGNFTPLSVDCKNKDDKTALHDAAQFSQYEACQKLLEMGADINALKRADWTPLMLACTKIIGEDTLKTVEVLLKNKAVVNYKNKDGWTVMHLISRGGDLDILKALLKKELDVHVKTNNGRTGLHIAALHGNIDVVKILLELGLEADEKDHCGNTPLHEAVLGNSIEVCKLLINYGADVTLTNNRGYSLLHMAASEGHLEIMDFLLSEYQWDINEVTEDGYTASHCAARNGHREAFDFLKGKDADLSIKDKCNREAASYFQ